RRLAVSFYDEQSAMQRLATPILNRCGEHVESTGFLAMEVEENGAAPEVLLNPLDQVLPDGFKERVPGRNPLKRPVLLENGFVEDNLSILSRQSANTKLQPVACGKQVPRDPAHAINMAVAGGCLRLDANDWRCFNEELLDDFGHQAPFPGFDRLPNN